MSEDFDEKEMEKLERAMRSKLLPGDWKKQEVRFASDEERRMAEALTSKAHTKRLESARPGKPIKYRPPTIRYEYYRLQENDLLAFADFLIIKIEDGVRHDYRRYDEEQEAAFWEEVKHLRRAGAAITEFRFEGKPPLQEPKPQPKYIAKPTPRKSYGERYPDLKLIKPMRRRG